MQDDQNGLGSNTATNILRIKQKIMRLYILIIFIGILVFSCMERGKPIARTIITNYYKTKNQAKVKILSEGNRIILDSVVIRLEESNEPTEVIQHIVNEFKMEYGE